MARASRGAQSTVDGFYAIHTKLTDSVECSPRHAETAKGGWGGLCRRADKIDNIGGGMTMRPVSCGHRDASGDDTRGYFAPRLEHKLGGDLLWCVYHHHHLINQTSARLFHPPLKIGR